MITTSMFLGVVSQRTFFCAPVTITTSYLKKMWKKHTYVCFRLSSQYPLPTLLQETLATSLLVHAILSAFLAV